MDIIVPTSVNVSVPTLGPARVSMASAAATCTPTYWVSSRSVGLITSPAICRAAGARIRGRRQAKPVGRGAQERPASLRLADDTTQGPLNGFSRKQEQVDEVGRSALARTS
jgi:hypothetical protein